jgi:hypothetical protein
MQTINCWRLEVVTNDGSIHLAARFTTEAAASEAKLACNHRPYPVLVTLEEIEMCEKASEWTSPHVLRESALAKLTDAEKEALLRPL